MTQRIYLDYASIVPLEPRVRTVMEPWMSLPANPSALHQEGRQVRSALDQARQSLAGLWGLAARQIVAVGSGSESIALALLGHARAIGQPGTLWTTRAEHAATVRGAAQLGAEGWHIRWVAVDTDGVIDLQQLEHELSQAPSGPRLVSIMLVNNELGTLNPVVEIAELVKAHGAVYHCDAIAAGLTTDLHPVIQHADLISLAAQKCGGPAGCGLLLRRSGVPLAPVIPGGAQEFGLRAGTENVAGFVGAAQAFMIREAELAKNYALARSLQLRFEASLQSVFSPEILRITAQQVARSVGMSHLSFADLDGAALLASADLAGLAVSAGSACAAGALARSPVLDAIGLNLGWTGILRVSWGTVTTRADIDEAAERVKAIVLRMREVQASQR